MTIPKSFAFVIPTILLFCSSCNKGFDDNNYTAYFGGEVTNPLTRYVILYKDDEIIDTLPLNKENRFFKKFDSLSPGMYTFKHEPEYQYVYFYKNDSLLVSINSQDFDNSIVFSGRGDQKNNFLMEIYLKEEKDRDKMYSVFDYDFKKFNAYIDSTHNKYIGFYKSKKEEIKWDANFDIYAKAAIDFPYYTKKEVYPVIHQLRTGNDIIEQLPKNYYAYRKKIDYDNVGLSNYSPFVKYLSHMLNNLATINYHNHFTEADLALKTNINKLDIADTLISNEKIKNSIFNNIAFTYLLEDQNMVNNQKFLKAYHKYSTDNSQKNEINKIGNAINLLKPGNALPDVQLVDVDGTTISSSTLTNQKTILFFWTEKAVGHLLEAHRQVLEIRKKYPQYQIIAVNLDDDQNKWVETLSKYKFDGITELRTANFEDLKSKWAIIKIHRTIILDDNGNISNAFSNLFANNFDTLLK